MAAYLEAEHVLAVASGTAALHLALLAVGVGPGDEVITSPITWPATANVIEHCGATPIFCDVQDTDLNIDPALVPALVTERTKAILPVHLAGQVADLDPILALGLPVVEDAAHAAESAYRGRKIGGISDASCFSLYATKNIAAGEGGLVATNRDDVAEAIRNMRLTRRGDGSHYDQVTAGFKANLSDVLAAIALVQLDRVEEHAHIRQRQFDLYDEGLAGLAGITPLVRDPRDVHALHLYVVRIDADAAGADRDAYQRGLADELIGTSIHFLPVHRLTWFRERYPVQEPVARRRACRCARCSRFRCHLRTRTTTSSMRSTRSGACTSGSPHEDSARPAHLAREATPANPDRRHADRARDRLHPAQDRPRADVGDAHFRKSLVVRAGRHDHDRDGAADGAAVEVAARGPGCDRPVLVADPLLLRLLYGRSDPPDVDRRRCGADLRDLEAPSRPLRRPDGDRRDRTRASVAPPRSSSAPSASCSR